MAYTVKNSKLKKLPKPSMWLYFQEEPAYEGEFSVYGQAYLKDGAENYNDAYTKILNDRVRSRPDSG